jgi:signal-transduction protein with cAMP-binding, CBS, and nucleotidyltransferase domain
MSDMATDLSTPAPPSSGKPEIPVGAVMRPPVTTVEPDAHLAGAAYLMKHQNTKALLVVAGADSQEVRAILTVSDIAHAIGDGRDPETTRISELHTVSPMTVERTVPVMEAARQMISAGIEHLPVTDHGRLVGIVDLADLCRPVLGLAG